MVLSRAAGGWGAAPEEPIDLFSGFEDTPPVQAEAVPPPPITSPFDHFSGYFELGTTFNFAHEKPQQEEPDWRGLSRVRAELQLEFRRRLGDGWQFFLSGKGWNDFAYAIKGRDDFPAGVLDEYEREVELGENYLQGILTESLDLKVGRQIVVWGRADHLRVADLLNPLDNREPGLVDIEDLRLPLVMSKLDYYRGKWDLALMGIHEHRFDKNPPFGHDFFMAPLPLPPEENPAHTFGNTELALELTGIFPGWDISFYGARLFNRQATIIRAPRPVQEHRKISMLGSAMNIVRGDFLVFFEAAHFRDLRFGADSGTAYNRTDLLGGMEYNGFRETTISVEAAHRHLHNYNDRLAASPELPRRSDNQLALDITRELLNDTLRLTAVIFIFGERAQHGALQRLSATYDLAGGWSITGGMLLFQSGKGALENFGDHDRVFFESRYDF